LPNSHYRTVQSLLDGAAAPAPQPTGAASPSATGRARPVGAGVLERPLTVALLSGALTPARRRHVRQLLSAGEIDIVVGTQALVQEGVEFRSWRWR
jgi:hypothetical protein